jgi:hypothetical protein
VLNVPLAELEPDMSTKAIPAVKEERRVNHESLQDRLDDTERTEILRALEAANGIVGDKRGGCSSRNKTFHTPASHAEVWYSRVAHNIRRTLMALLV